MDELIKQLQSIEIVKKMLNEGSEVIMTDSRGYAIGRLQDSESEIVVRDMTGTLYGRYNKASDYTTDACGRPIGQGNLLAMCLIRK